MDNMYILELVPFQDPLVLSDVAQLQPVSALSVEEEDHALSAEEDELASETAEAETAEAESSSQISPLSQRQPVQTSQSQTSVGQTSVG